MHNGKKVSSPDPSSVELALQLRAHSCALPFLSCVRQFMIVAITDDMIGHKLGEFAHTRKDFSFRSVHRLLAHIIGGPHSGGRIRALPSSLVFNESSA